MDTIVLSFWLFLPAGAANAAPILAAHVPVLHTWNQPIDGNLAFGGKALLGSHKTWRGLVSGILCAIAVVWLQQGIIVHVSVLDRLFAAWPQYLAASPVVLGILLGGGALLGDAVKSFFKRRLDIAPGKPWVPFDQIDYIVGAGILSFPVVRLPALAYVTSLLLWPGLHVVATNVGYRLQLKERPL